MPGRDSGLQAANEIGILQRPNVERIVKAFKADRSQLFNPWRHVESRFSKLAINEEKGHCSYGALNFVTFPRKSI